jgi:hypothetical protein
MSHVLLQAIGRPQIDYVFHFNLAITFVRELKDSALTVRAMNLEIYFDVSAGEHLSQIS